MISESVDSTISNWSFFTLRIDQEKRENGIDCNSCLKNTFFLWMKLTKLIKFIRSFKIQELLNRPKKGDHSPKRKANVKISNTKDNQV